MIRVNTVSFKLTAAGLGKSLPANARERVVEEAGKAYYRACRRSISLRDHSLTDLANLDHPYARRHGRILSGRLGHSNPLPGPHGDSRVHTKPRGKPASHDKQTGALVRSLKQRPQGGAWRVYFDTGVAPHAERVVSGSRFVLGRDVLWLTGHEKSTQRAMMIAVVKVLGKELRTKSAIRFQRIYTKFG